MIMPSVLDKILEEEQRIREYGREKLSDGSLKTLIFASGKYRIMHAREPAHIEFIFESEFADLAASVYDAFDGKDRGWHKAFLPRGVGGMESTEKRLEREFSIYAVGATIPDCITAFADWMGSPVDLSSIQPLDDDDDDEQYQWGVRFLLDGTGMKAAVPRCRAATY
jgi:hypothetical protein